MTREAQLATALPGGFTRPELLGRVAAHYAQRLRRSALAVGWLESQGLGHSLLWDAFHLGWADGTLPTTLPAQGPVRDALVQLGVLTAHGVERLAGCLVVPLSHPDRGVVGLYGYRLGPGDPSRERWLPGSEDGVFNWPALKGDDPLLLTGTILDALAVWRAGRRAVSCLLHPSRLSPGLDGLLQRYRIAQVHLCLARVPPALVDQLAGRGIASRHTAWPAGSPRQVLAQAGPEGLKAALPPDDGLDLAVWQARFQRYMEARHWTERTMESYRLELRRFFRFLATQEVGQVQDITREAVEAYRTYLFQAPWRTRRLAPRTQMAGMTAVKAFTRFLCQARYVLVDPTQGVALPRVPRGLPRTLLSEAQVDTLMAATHAPTPLSVRNRAILEVLYSTAIRNSELRRLSLSDIALDRRLLSVRYGKGRKSRLVPLGGEAVRWLQRWLSLGRPELVGRPEEPALFVSQRGGPLSRDTLAWMVKRAGYRAGLAVPVTPHLLRHCCATHMLARGAGLRALQGKRTIIHSAATTA